MNNKKEKGITLIALVVTIVILLILAGISMKMVIGENGIIKKAKDARVNQVHSAVKEGIILSHNQYTIEDGTGESNSTTFKDYIEGKGIIDENGIINVVNLLGKKQHLGNGSNIETGDVYVFEESDDVYRVKYYDEKKEEHLIDEFEKGSTGEDWAETDPRYFEVDDDGEIHLKEEYRYQYYRGTAKWTEENLVIPEEIDGKKVTKIGGRLTNYMKSILRKVKIPNTVTVIGEGAFKDCTELEDVIISEGVTSLSIADRAFEDCYELASITIPEGVTEIGDRAFGGCNKLISITIPSSVENIGEYAFEIGSVDRLLKSIKVSKENKNYDSRNNCNALIETSTNTLVLGCNNTIIPDTIIKIDDYAFWGCNQLKDIIIPASVIDVGTFSGCYVLNSIGVAAENQNYDSRNNCNALIETSTNTLILGCNNTIIPNSIIKIGDYAFGGCDQLKDIIIPASVVEIGKGAFYGCSGLNSIGVAAENENYDSRNDCNALIEKSTNTLILGCNNTIIPNSIIKIGDYAFGGCDQLKDIIIPASVVEIGEGAFYGSGLTSVTIPNSVTKIGNAAFEDCTALTSVTMPEGIKMIADWIFSECSKLESITIPNSVWSIGYGAFSNCDSLKTINYTGTVSEWKNIKLSNGNDALTNATIVYNYTPSNQ